MWDIDCFDDRKIEAASAVVTDNGDLVFYDEEGETIRAIANGHWMHFNRRVAVQ